MYEKFEKLMQMHNVTPYKVSKETGIPYSALSDWKNGKSTPKNDKLQKLADYFNVTLEYLVNGKPEIEFNYLNEESKKIAEDAYKNPDLRILFHAAKDVSPEDLQFVIEFVKKFSKKNGN
jgi:transcriptional regulator with XRE-family HTH domain